MGQERQFVVEGPPAAGGFRSDRKRFRLPVEVMWEGMSPMSQRRRSMSWQAFVSKAGAEVSDRRQFPLGWGVG